MISSIHTPETISSSIGYARERLASRRSARAFGIACRRAGTYTRLERRASALPAPGGAPGGALARVLVADDDEHVLAFLEEALSTEGYDVVTATNGYEALRTIRETPPDLIVLDLMMPSLDGFGFLEIYRDIPAQRAPLIAISASREAIRTVEGGVDAVVHKPIDIGHLLRVIQHYLGHAQP